MNNPNNDLPPMPEGGLSNSESRTDEEKDYKPDPDYTQDPDASGRTFHLRFGGFLKYGTTDAAQGASFFLAFALILVATITFLLSLFVESSEYRGFFEWLTTPLMLTIGVAVGRGSAQQGERMRHDKLY